MDEVNNDVATRTAGGCPHDLRSPQLDVWRLCARSHGWLREKHTTSRAGMGRVRNVRGSPERRENSPVGQLAATLNLTA